MESNRGRIRKLLVIIIAAKTRIQTLNGGEEHQATRDCLDKIVRLSILYAVYLQQKFLALRHDDERICDMPLEEENRPLYKNQVRFTRIESFQDENEAFSKTNFTTSELWELNEHFGLPEIVRVPIPNQSSCHLFHREELLIYTLIKMREGNTHVQMEEYVTGSESRRWSHGYKYFVG